MLGVGQRDLGDLAAEALDLGQGRLEDLAHAGVDVVARRARSGTPKRRPARSSRPGSATPPSSPTEVESSGSRPCRIAEQQRRVG